jgi:hypothetical protein
MDERSCWTCKHWRGKREHDRDGAVMRTCRVHGMRCRQNFLCRRGWEPLGRKDTEDDGYPD